MDVFLMSYLAPKFSQKKFLKLWKQITHQQYIRLICLKKKSIQNVKLYKIAIYSKLIGYIPDELFTTKIFAKKMYSVNYIS